jgi:signal peptidase I
MSKVLLGSLLSINSLITVHQIHTHFITIQKIDSNNMSPSLHKDDLVIVLKYLSGIDSAKKSDREQYRNKIMLYKDQYTG